MDLEGECFGDGKDFGEVGDLGVAEFFEHLFADKLVGIFVEDVLKILAGVGDI